MKHTRGMLLGKLGSSSHMKNICVAPWWENGTKRDSWVTWPRRYSISSYH